MKVTETKPSLTGAEIRAFRMKYGMSQTELSRLFELSIDTIQRLEAKDIVTNIVFTLAFFWLIHRVESGEINLSDVHDADDLLDSARITAEELTWEREDLGLTQSALAKLLGVSYATVNRWENGHVNVSTMPVIALALGRVKEMLEEQRAEKKIA